MPDGHSIFLQWVFRRILPFQGLVGQWVYWGKVL